MGPTHSTEILPHVLTHLDPPTLYHCALLNREVYMATRQLLWRNGVPENQAMASSSLGRTIQYLHLEDFAFTDELMVLLMVQTPAMTTVVLDNASQITDKSMQYVPDYWPRLDSLQISGSAMTDFDVFNTLRHLELWNCSGLLPTTFARPFALDSLIVDMHEPIALDFSGLVHLGDLCVYGGLAPDSHGWPPNLRTLYLDECFDWMEHNVLALVRSCPRLTQLTLEDGLLSDDVLVVLLDLPNLTHLDLSYNNQLSAQAIRQFVHQTHVLRLLTLTYCGMTMAQFPEAGDQCAGQVVTTANTEVRLNHLDAEALFRMRHG